MKLYSGLATKMESDCLIAVYPTHGPFHCMMDVDTTMTVKWFETTHRSDCTTYALTKYPNGSIIERRGEHICGIRFSR